jgi:hypothetical protein
MPQDSGLRFPNYGLVTGLRCLFLGDSSLETPARIGVLEPGEREHANRQAPQQRDHQHPDPEAALLNGRLLRWKRRHAPVWGRRILISGRAIRGLPGRLRPGRICWWVRSAQSLQVSAAILTESCARWILPGAIRTGDQMNASCIGQRSSPNVRILNGRWHWTSRLLPYITAPCGDRVRHASHFRSG